MGYDPEKQTIRLTYSQILTIISFAVGGCGALVTFTNKLDRIENVLQEQVSVSNTHSSQISHVEQLIQDVQELAQSNARILRANSGVLKDNSGDLQNLKDRKQIP